MILESAHIVGERLVDLLLQRLLPVSYTHLDVYKRQILPPLKMP